MGVPTPAEIRRFPKVLLHDHLDGGLRPTTLEELSAVAGLPRATTGPPGPPGPPSLAAYLEMFSHCLAVMQSVANLRRVAREAVEDLREDGVVYAEVRFAPELHTQDGLNPAQAVEAVLEGLRDGIAMAGTQRVEARLVLTAMRTSARSVASSTARLAAGYRHDGVAGFDLAGLEAGHPASDHLEAIAIARSAGVPVTVHAGEDGDLSSLQDAVFACGAQRIGHGVRLADDIGPGGASPSELGPTATYVRQRRLTLEMCPSSNVHTGAVPSLRRHPAGRFVRLGLPVTINTDNRLMSGVTLSSELAACCEVFGWGWEEVRQVTANALEGAFCEDAIRAEVASAVAAVP